MKKCSKEGNEDNNNCDECIDNYIFLNDSTVPLQNCYEKCPNLYYFNENNQYYCTESCPPEYGILIPQKNKCINDCKKDNEYMYEYDNYCLRECPEDKKIDVDEKKCVQSCKENQFEFNNKCYNEVPKDNNDIDSKGNIYVKNVSNFDNILTNLLNSDHLSDEGSSIIIEREDDIVYEITNTKNELDLLKNLTNFQNISIIDLGECENILKRAYHINENDSLIIVKSEQKSGKASDKNVIIDVYEPYNKTQLNLSLYDDNPINILIPMELDKETKQLYEQMKESGYNMFDINDPFYQDICTPFDSSDGTDILLSDRINFIYNNDNTKCQPNCKLSIYSVELHFLNCSCTASSEVGDENFEKKEKFTAKKIYESFYEVLKYSNYDIIKCLNIVLDIKTISTNIGSILVISYFAFYLVCLVFYIIKGLTPLKNKLAKDIKKNNIKIKSNINNLFYPPIRKSVIKTLVLRADIEKKRKRSIKNIRKTNRSNNNNDNIIVYSNMVSCKDILDSSPKEEISDSKLENELKYVKKDFKVGEKINYSKKETLDESKKIYSDFELNELEYLEAIKLDKRTLLQTYWATLKREHLLIFTFINCNDYNLLFIKLARCIFLIVTDMALNVFFFSDESMHKLYINYGKYDFFQQIPQITYSTIISQLIEVFLCFLSLTDKHFYRINTHLIAGNNRLIKKVIKCINIKLIIFFAFTFVFFVLYWYIISIFCGVYRNTQIHFIKDSAISFSISLAYSFILYFISSGLRILSLRDKKKRCKCIYSFSYVIPFF